MSDSDDLLTNDDIWWRGFAASLQLLEDWASGQLELWPVDDFLADKQYVPCPRRRTHRKLGECWLCWCDVAWGHATAADVLAPRRRP